jgi:hypothetical protein
MKSHLSLVSIVTLLGLASPVSAALVANLQAPLNVAVFLTQNNALPPRDFPDGTREMQVSFVTARLTTRDFIEKLIEDGRIVGPLSGWRIVARIPSDAAFDIAHRLYAVKPGQPDHALDEPTLSLASKSTMSAFRVRSRNDEILRGGGSVRGSVTGTFFTPAAALDVAAVFDKRYTYRIARLGSLARQVAVPDSITLDVVGHSRPEEEPYIVGGAIAFGRHQITSVRVEQETE